MEKKRKPSSSKIGKAVQSMAVIDISDEKQSNLK